MKVRSALMIPGTENIGWVQLITISMRKLKGIKNQGAASGVLPHSTTLLAATFTQAPKRTKKYPYRKNSAEVC